LKKLLSSKKAQDDAMSAPVRLFIVVVMVFTIAFITFLVFKPFFLPNVVSYNFYESYSSNIKSLVENPQDGRNYKMIFGATCNDNVDDTLFNDFEGTIFLVSNNGEVSLPFPELTRFESRKHESDFNHWVTTDSQGSPSDQLLPYQLISIKGTKAGFKRIYIPRDKLSGDCSKTACICYSKKSLKGDEIGDSTVSDIVANPYNCKSFNIPKDVVDVSFVPDSSINNINNICKNTKSNAFFNLVLQSKVDSSVENQKKITIYYSLTSSGQVGSSNGGGSNGGGGGF